MVVKGILDLEDVKRAVDVAVDGIIVSNHGGRQLDGISSAVKVLTKIVDFVAGRLSVLVDGGVHSGLDVIKILALGADAVLLGRARAFALATGYELGAKHLLNVIQNEIRIALALSGKKMMDEVDRNLLVNVPTV
ncbi:MAG: hypothetical protein CBC09_06385 [Cellvibrionales bacterium TMED49]|nr:MAG: hypothetical protein CBC09_06385 [Cellvibrionales bacterium TMED49]